MNTWFGDVRDRDTTDEEASESGEETETESNATATDSDEEMRRKWMKASDSESETASEDDEKRHKSTREKFRDELQTWCDQVEFEVELGNWTEALASFNSLVSVLKRGSTGTYPRVFLRTLREIQSVFEKSSDAERREQLKEEEENLKEQTDKDPADIKKKVDDLVQERKSLTIFGPEVRRWCKECEEMMTANLDIDSEEEAEEEEKARREREEKEKQEDWSEEALIARIVNLSTQRGKRSYTFKRITEHAQQQNLTHVVISAYAHWSLAVLDDDPGQTHVSSSSFRRAVQYLTKAMELEGENPTIVVVENEPISMITPRRVSVPGGFQNCASRLFVECIRGLQFTEGFNADFQMRFRDETSITAVLDKVLAYYQNRKQKKGIARCAALLLEVLHARRQNIHAQLVDNNFVNIKTDLYETIKSLHALVLRNGADSATEARCTLFVVYHLSLAGNYYAARDLLLTSRLHEQRTFKQDLFRITYNRTIAQLGIAAFRNGLFNDAYTVLLDIVMKRPAEMKELLGQAVRHQRHFEFDVKQEIEDRERLVPYHAQINMEVLDAVFMVSALIVDVVGDAINPNDRFKQRNNPFMKSNQHFANQHLLGEPTNLRGRIFAAAEAMKRGDCAKALGYVENLSAWDGLENGDEVRREIRDRICVESLRTFLVLYTTNYATITLAHLATKFQLPDAKVKAVVSKLIIDGIINVTWDQSESFVTVTGPAPPRLHRLAMQCADKVSNFASYNDDLYSQMQHTSKSRDQYRGGARWGGSGGRGRGGGGAPPHRR